MALADRARRVELLKDLEARRGSRVIAYVTSTRPNFEVRMNDDAIRVVYDHLAAQDFGDKKREERQIDLLIHSNGGSGAMPWRLVNLIREFAGRFEVLVPHRAYSAATLTALGADKIVMHPMGELGPIDPSVANAFNPRDPTQNNQPIPISVEDVLAYIALVKEDVGIRHEDELVHAFTAFMNSPQLPVHPLALGNVKRHHARAKMVAKKLLLKHMSGDDESRIDRIVENLTSKLFYHGHPISRGEAKHDLDLKVDLEVDVKVLDSMWALYVEYERELRLTTPFKPNAEYEEALTRQGATPPIGTPNPQPPVQMMMPMGGMGPVAANPPVTIDLPGAVVESASFVHVLETKVRLKKFVAGPQEVMNFEALREEWTRYP